MCRFQIIIQVVVMYWSRVTRAIGNKQCKCRIGNEYHNYGDLHEEKTTLKFIFDEKTELFNIGDELLELRRTGISFFKHVNREFCLIELFILFPLSPTQSMAV
jgi:hypothetical protein